AEAVAEGVHAELEGLERGGAVAVGVDDAGPGGFGSAAGWGGCAADVGGFGVGGDAFAAGVGVRGEVEHAGALPGLPAAHAVEVEGAVVLFGGCGLVGASGAADAAPGGQVELVGAVVAVAGVGGVAAAGFAHAEL